MNNTGHRQPVAPQGSNPRPSCSRRTPKPRPQQDHETGLWLPPVQARRYTEKPRRPDAERKSPVNWHVDVHLEGEEQR